MTEEVMQRFFSDGFNNLEKLMNVHHDSMQNQINEVKKQAEKTDKKVDEITTKVNNMLIDDEKHYRDYASAKSVYDLENCLDKRIDHLENRISKIDFVFENPKLTIGGIAVLVMVAIAFINMEINYKVGNTLDPIANSLFFLRDKNEKQGFRGDNPKNYLNQKDTIK